MFIDEKNFKVRDQKNDQRKDEVNKK